MKTKKLHMDPLDLTALCNGLVFFAPVALLVRSTAGVSTEQFFVLQALLSAVVLATEVPSGWLTDRIGCQRTLVLYQLTNLGAKGLLLAAWHLHSLPLFVLEAVVEGLGASLASGTRSAYLYRTLPPEQYLIRLAQVDNWGTVGFLVSTVAYGALYRWGGLGLLLGATTVVSALGAAAAFRLQPEPPCPAAQLDRRPRGLGLGELLRTGPVAALMMLLAALSMGRLLVNFFYVEKLTACGLPESWMGPLILGYAGLELLCPRILGCGLPESWMGPLILGYAGLELLCPRILGRIRQGRGLVGALILSGMVLGLLGLSLPRWGTVALMLVLPLLLDLASCLLDQAENDQIDRLGRQEQRAELLSLFNMGVNLLEMGSAPAAGSGLLPVGPGGERPDRPAGPPGAAGRAAVAVQYGGQPVGDGVLAGVLGGVRPGQRGLLWGGGHRSGRCGAGLCRTPDTEKERVRWNF